MLLTDLWQLNVTGFETAGQKNPGFEVTSIQLSQRINPAISRIQRFFQALHSLTGTALFQEDDQ